MNDILQHHAHELRIALIDSGLTWDGVTGNADEWPRRIDELIADHLRDFIEANDDERESRYGR